MGVCTAAVAFHVANRGSLWFVQTIDCNVKHCFFQSVNFLSKQQELQMRVYTCPQALPII